MLACIYPKTVHANSAILHFSKKNHTDDLIFAKRTEDAFRKYEREEFIEMDFNVFLKETKEW
ncbi:MAG: hypothetical protein DRN71_05845 [Candidatus Nanohalarchaeota archaeon]|nr:MAG: hypothetical protein DRN71_05845 [Candidatus Nanohaloarchaeota archaeon]